MIQELYESYFVFALVWAYGSCLFNDGQTDYRAEFRCSCPPAYSWEKTPPQQMVPCGVWQEHQLPLWSFCL